MTGGDPLGEKGFDVSATSTAFPPEHKRSSIVKTKVIRSITDEEQVLFEGEYASEDEAHAAVTAQLAVCRDHMARYNADVILVHQKQHDALQAASELLGEQIKARRKELADLDEQIRKSTRRLGVA